MSGLACKQIVQMKQMEMAFGRQTKMDRTNAKRRADKAKNLHTGVQRAVL